MARGNIELLEARTLLALLACQPYPAHGSAGIHRAGAVAALPAPLEPQYAIHQTPRVQLGNAPLAGTPADLGTDQVELLWQTQTIGTGESDRFRVRFRAVGDTDWQLAALNPPLVIDYQPGDRTMFSASIAGLRWDTRYEYVVDHFRGEELLLSYDAEFRTRLAAGDSTPFTFTAYGDSSWPATTNLAFKAVQQRILELDPRFNLLLGDNIYEWGTHVDADSRFSPALNEPATDWIAGHVDYFAIGNHDGLLNPHQGQPSRDSYAVPVPVVGVNAFAAPTAREFPEHNYSFDYGDVHLVTYDTNAADLLDEFESMERIEAMLDYVKADLRASGARWKIVFAHHPLAGTDKNVREALGPYFQSTLTALREAGADLLLVGDSHTYSWSFPLQGFQDADGSGTLEPAEVLHAGGDASSFTKGSGLVQVVSGVGGRSLRADPYEAPFIAAAYSLAPHNRPLEYGFSRVDVRPDRLVVSYVSAATGLVVGDLNGNGVRDAGEDGFGRFEIVMLPGDVGGNGMLDVSDIDLLCAAILAGQQPRDSDVDGDGRVTRADQQFLVERIFASGPGDANLDRLVDTADRLQVFQAGQYEGVSERAISWAEGDWNCDGRFDSADLVAMFQSGRYQG